MFEQGSLLGQLDQHLAIGRGGSGNGALDQQPAHAVFQGLDPLRHRRRRDAERQRRALETAFAHHRGQCAQVAVIDFHDISCA